MSLDGLCVFKKMADKYPELHPINHPKDIFIAAECYDCRGQPSCKHYLPVQDTYVSRDSSKPKISRKNEENHLSRPINLKKEPSFLD